jgi:hypothetical protein
LLHPDCNIQETELFKQLGCPDLSLAHLQVLLSCREDVALKPDNWFASLYEYLDSKYCGDQRLKKLPIVRLANGMLVSSSFPNTIYFPPEQAVAKYNFHASLRIVKQETLGSSLVDQATSKQFLKNWGVKQFSAGEIAFNCLLPLYKTPSQFRSLQEVDCFRHLLFLKDNLSFWNNWDEGQKEEFRSSFRVRTNQGYYAPVSRCFLSSKYTNSAYKLEKLLPENDHIFFVDDTYPFLEVSDGELISVEKNDPDFVSWSSCFKDLGALLCPKVVKTYPYVKPLYDLYLFDCQDIIMKTCMTSFPLLR